MSRWFVTLSRQGSMMSQCGRSVCTLTEKAIYELLMNPELGKKRATENQILYSMKYQQNQCS